MTHCCLSYFCGLSVVAQVVSGESVQRILSSFLYVVSHHSNASVHALPLMLLFSIFHQLRARLIDQNNAGSQVLRGFAQGLSHVSQMFRECFTMFHTSVAP